MKPYIMKHIYTIFFAIWLFSGIANGQSWTSSNRTVSDEDVAVTKTVIDPDGNIISLGYFEGSVTFSTGESLASEGARDYYLAKYDDTGNLIWLRGIGGASNEFSQGGVDVDDQGNIYATGGFQGILHYSDTYLHR